MKNLHSIELNSATGWKTWQDYQGRPQPQAHYVLEPIPTRNNSFPVACFRGFTLPRNIRETVVPRTTEQLCPTCEAILRREAA